MDTSPAVDSHSGEQDNSNGDASFASPTPNPVTMLLILPFEIRNVIYVLLFGEFPLDVVKVKANGQITHTNTNLVSLRDTSRLLRAEMVEYLRKNVEVKVFAAYRVNRALDQILPDYTLGNVTSLTVTEEQSYFYDSKEKALRAMPNLRRIVVDTKPVDVTTRAFWWGVARNKSWITPAPGAGMRMRKFVQGRSGGILEDLVVLEMIGGWMKTTRARWIEGLVVSIRGRAKGENGGDRWRPRRAQGDLEEPGEHEKLQLLFAMKFVRKDDEMSVMFDLGRWVMTQKTKTRRLGQP